MAPEPLNRSLTESKTLIRLGLTMRVVRDEATNEERDALARDWGTFLAGYADALFWVPIPNIGEPVVRLVEKLELTGIVLSGGNDVGSCPVRDSTERFLLEFAVARKRPILGVCRGAQMIQTFFGGTLVTCSRDSHVGREHEVDVGGSPWNPGISGSHIVNSFHGFGVPVTGLAPEINCFARTNDGLAEGIFHRDLPIAGIQWHPEREKNPSVLSLSVMKSFLERNR